MNDNKELSRNISIILKELRKEKKYTQKDVAEILHITREAYTMYETGKSIPTVESLVKLADLYKCSLDYITGRYGDSLNSAEKSS